MNGHWSASFFFNEMRGFMGFNGISSNTVLRTTNGGTTWTGVTLSPPLQSGIVHPVTDIWFRDSLTGWMTMWSSTGVDPALWHTTDGGSTWLGMPGLSQMHYASSVRQTPTELLVTEHPIINGSGNLVGGGLWSSTDSGGTWNYRPGVRNIGLEFFNGLYGISTAYRAPFLYTNNGGQTWNAASAPDNFVHEAWSAYPWKKAGIFIAVPEDSGGTASKVYRTRKFTNGYLWDPPKVQLNFATTGHIAGVDNVIYICNSGQFGAATPGFYRSMDTGNTWISVGGPTTDQDTRFSVTGCGDVVYAFDKSGEIYKTNNGGGGPPIPQCVFINKDSLGTLISLVCDSAHNKFWLHNTNYDGVFIQDLRIIDTIRKPWRSGSVYYDSIPPPYASLNVGDSLLIDLGWRPRLMIDSTGSDSAVLRVIFTVPYLNYRFDTVFLPLKLKALSSSPSFTLSATGIQADSVSPCVPFDTMMSMTNTGCDTLVITNANVSILSPWSLSDSAGKPLALPIKLAPNQSTKYLLTVSPNGTKGIQDSLKVKMHYQGHDSIATVLLHVSGKYVQAVASTQTPMQFDSLATCTSFDSLVVITNAGCSSVQLTAADVTGSDWTIVDTNGNAISYPIVIPPGTHGVLKLRFAPKLTGPKSAKLTLHILNGATNSTSTIQLDGKGVDAGTFAYLRSFDLGPVSICNTRDTSIVFRNTTCGQISLRAVQAFGNYAVIDSGILPRDIPKGGAQQLHLRFTPNGKSVQDGKIIVFYMIDGNIVEDTITLTGIGASGASTFEMRPQTTKLDFGATTECGTDSTVTFKIYNNGNCDTMRVTSVTLDGTLLPAFGTTSSMTLPAALRPAPLTNDTLTVTISTVQLVAGSYNGSLHIQYMLADGSTHSVDIPTAVSITGGPHFLVLDTKPIDFGAISGCTAHDTTIMISDTGCAALSVTERTLTGTGFTLVERGDSLIVVKPGEKIPIHIHFDGSGSGPTQAQITVKTNSDLQANRTIMITADVQPAQNVNFLLKVTNMPVKKNAYFNVELYPDRDVAINGLNSVSGVLEFYDDNFQMNANPTVMAGTTLSTWSTYRIGTLRHAKFDVTSTKTMVLDHTVPLLTLQLQEVIADSVASTIFVDSLAMNGSTPNFGDCIQSNRLASVGTAFTPDCGDSMVIMVMRGQQILLIAPPNPNPITRESGSRLHFNLESIADGAARVEIFDALGRSRAIASQTLAKGGNDVALDLSNLEGGSYYYSIHFESEAGTVQHRGSIVVMK